MEPRANHLLVGAFVLLGLVAAFAITIWLARIQGVESRVSYQIYFRGSVQGLGVGADVRYRGIRVGSIRDITIDPQDPTRVSVMVDIDDGTPIREGDRAVLEYQGLTGIATINIGGALTGSPPLQPPEESELAVIPSTTSPFEELVAGAPELVKRAIVLMDRASTLLRPENQQRFDAVLADLQVFTGEMADNRERIARTLEALEGTSRSLEQATATLADLGQNASQFLASANGAAETAESTLKKVDSVVARDMERLVADLRGAARSLAVMATDARQMVAENRKPINAFTQDGLAEFSRLVGEARVLVSSLSRLSDRVERDGARFLFGRSDSEFRPQ